jgi:poly(3-hydroxybutyrate) depolymerase
MNTTRSRAVRTALALFAVVLVAPPTARAANIADFTDYSLRNSGGQVLLPGRLFTPPEAASSATPRPLMVFLHGGGAAGTNNTTQIQQTPDYMLDEAKRRGAHLYVPQAPVTWASLSHVDSVMTMINRAVADLHADADRLYVTGYSNGGGGTWNLLSRNRDRFAAAFTLSAVAPAPGFVPANLRDTPLFAIHARDDATVPVARTREVVNSILTAAATPRPVYPSSGNPLDFIVANPSQPLGAALLTAPPDLATTFAISGSDIDLAYYEAAAGGHTGLLGIFYSPLIYEWMFDHTLAVPEPGTASLLVVSGVLLLRRRRGRCDTSRNHAELAM